MAYVQNILEATGVLTGGTATFNVSADSSNNTTLLMAVTVGSGGTATSVTDSNGRTWAIDVQSALAGRNAGIVRIHNGTSPLTLTGSDTITVNGTSGAAVNVVVCEFSDIRKTTPLDKSTSSGSNGTGVLTILPGTSGTLSVLAEQVFACCGLGVGKTFTTTPPTNDAAFSNVTEGVTNMGVAQALVNATTAHNAEWIWAGTTTAGAAQATYISDKVVSPTGQSITIAESRTVFIPTLYLNITQNVNVDENRTLLVPTLYINVNQTIAITDIVRYYKDTIYITESATVVLGPVPLSISVSQNISIAESVTLQSPPIVALNTADAYDFGADSTPTLDFTGTDLNANDITYNLQVLNLCDSYSESNQNTYLALFSSGGNTYSQIIQSFTGNGRKLQSVKLYLAKAGAASGALTVSLYTHTGTYGVSSLPDVWVEDSSTSINASSLTTSYALYTFNFAGTNTLANGTNYCIQLSGSIGGVGRAVYWGADNDSPSHSGNAARNESGSWVNYSTHDLCFYVYTTVLDKLSNTDPGFANPDVGGDTDPFTSGDNIQYTVQAGDALGYGTYYWLVRGKDPSGTNSYGDWSAVRYFTVEPALLIPSAAEAITISESASLQMPPTVVLNTANAYDFGNDTTPTLQFTGTDPNGDAIEYNIQIDTTSTFSGTTLSPGTMADDATVGTVAWSNPDNAKTSNDVYANATTGDDIPPTGGIPKDYAVNIVKADGTIGTTNKATGTTISSTESYISYGGSSDLWGESWTPADINDVDFGVVYAVNGGSGGGIIISHYLKATNFGFSVPSGATINGILAEVEVKKSGYSPYPGAYVDHIRITVSYTSSSLLNKFSVTPDAGFTAGHPFASGATIDYTVQAGDALGYGTYYWRVEGKDPSGTNSYGAWSATNNFTVEPDLLVAVTDSTVAITEAVIASIQVASSDSNFFLMFD